VKTVESSLGRAYVKQNGRGVTVHLDEPVQLDAGTVWDVKLA